MTNEAIAERVVDAIIAREKGFVDHPSDRGGATKYGITEAVARANGYTGDMRSLPLGLARTIYRRRYWDAPGFGRVAAVSETIAAELADTGVNMGPTTAALMFQRWLNALNRRQKDYADLFVDGAIGPVTVGALRAYLDKRGDEGEAVLVAALNCIQGARYLDIVEGDDRQEDFMYGWLLHRVVTPA